MPLYDCMLLLKPHVQKEAIVELVSRVGKHVQTRNGVVTNIKSFGTVHLGYGIKKRENRFYQGELMQMTMMATPNINKELHYLNREDRLLRWLLVKHRETKYGVDFLGDDHDRSELSRFSRSSFLDNDDIDEDSAEDDDDDDEEYDKEQEEKEQP